MKVEGKEEAAAVASVDVDELLETLLTEVDVFSRGRPCLSKNWSAHAAISLDDFFSTSCLFSSQEL